jgi:hypothetical protein
MENSHDDIRQQRVRRIPYRVRLVMHPKDGSERFEGQARDLSMGGMFIETILPLKPGTVFDVEIPMQPLNFRGSVKVLWTRLVDEGRERPYGMAVQWFNLTPAQRKLVYRQIDDHLRGGGDLLVGTPEAEREGRSPTQSKVTSKAAAPDRAWLLAGLAITAVVVLVLLILL